MTFRIVQCTVEEDEIVQREVIATGLATTEAAEARAAAVAASHPHSGFDGMRSFWWARDDDGTKLRFYVEVSDFDETDGV